MRIQNFRDMNSEEWNIKVCDQCVGSAGHGKGYSSSICHGSSDGSADDFHPADPGSNLGAGSYETVSKLKPYCLLRHVSNKEA